jgi:hypothetical protein
MQAPEDTQGSLNTKAIIEHAASVLYITTQ